MVESRQGTVPVTGRTQPRRSLSPAGDPRWPTELQRADWVLDVGGTPVTEARDLLAHTVLGLPGEHVDEVLLLASELVTNAVCHGAAPVLLSVTWGDGSVRVEVADQSPARPVLKTVEWDAPSGRGLLLVDGLASDWGALASGSGKTVWFTLSP